MKIAHTYIHTYIHTSRKRKRIAFTLAEVLITLGIIGVVAAMTIPTLITQYQKQQTVEQLKKAYSTLQQATVRSTVDNGAVSGWDFTLSGDAFFNLYYAPYLKIVQTCTTYPYCRTGASTDLAGNSPAMFGNPTNVLQDGTFVYYTNSNGWQTIVVDLNGNAGPNKVGKDIFAFSVFGNGLHTYDQYHNNSFDRASTTSAGTSGQCNTGAAGGRIGAGSYCSRLIEMDGWQIKDDYPW